MIAAGTPPNEPGCGPDRREVPVTCGGVYTTVCAPGRLATAKRREVPRPRTPVLRRRPPRVGLW
jgi:hypothetical protein